MATPPIIALDIGATKVACAIGRLNALAPGFELLGNSLVPYPIRIESWPCDPLLIGRTIEQAIEATAVTGSFAEAHVSLSDPSLRAQVVQAAIELSDEAVHVRQRDLDRLTACALNLALGVDRDALLVERLGCSGNGFTNVRNPIGFAATRLTGTFHIVSMPMTARRVIVQAVEAAGLEAARLTYSLAATAAALDGMGGSRRTLLIDIGGLASDAGYVAEGALSRSCTVPWGGTTLALDIARAVQVTVEQAAVLSLEGLSCRRTEARACLEARLGSLEQAIKDVLEGQPLPDQALLTGRGALIDGIVEWVERVSGVHASMGRSARTQSVAELSRQIGLNPAIGVLELATRPLDAPVVPARQTRLFGRLLDRTKTLLTEYF